MERLDIVDQNAQPIGLTIDRDTAHAEGIRHRTSHVWILRRRGGCVEILLQKRSKTKDSFPGCYDISSAGHIPAGMDFVPSALRELKEEYGDRIGITGNVPPVDILRNGSWEQIQGCIRKCIEDAGDNPKGYTICPGCTTPVGTSKEQMIMFMNAATTLSRRARKGCLPEGLK